MQRLFYTLRVVLTVIAPVL